MWQNHSLLTLNKVGVYVAVIISTLMYAAETWVLYRKHIQLLGRFHQRCLQSIMGIYWHDYDTNIKVPERARMPRIKAMLLHRHLRWADHVVLIRQSRMEVNHQTCSPAARGLQSEHCYGKMKASKRVGQLSNIFG